MTLPLPSALTPSDEPPRPHRFRLIATTILTMAAVASIGVWQLRPRHNAGTASLPPRSMATAPAAGAGRTHVEIGPVPQVRPMPTLYVVASDEQEVLVEQYLGEANWVRLQSGEPLASDSVLNVAGMAPEVASELVNGVDVRVVDLRWR
jgi:hypothetical protein